METLSASEALRALELDQQSLQLEAAAKVVPISHLVVDPRMSGLSLLLSPVRGSASCASAKSSYTFYLSSPRAASRLRVYGTFTMSIASMPPPRGASLCVLRKLLPGGKCGGSFNRTGLPSTGGELFVFFALRCWHLLVPLEPAASIVFAGARLSARSFLTVHSELSAPLSLPSGSDVGAALSMAVFIAHLLCCMSLLFCRS